MHLFVWPWETAEPHALHILYSTYRLLAEVSWFVYVLSHTALEVMPIHSDTIAHSLYSNLSMNNGLFTAFLLFPDSADEIITLLSVMYALCLQKEKLMNRFYGNPKPQAKKSKHAKWLCVNTELMHFCQAHSISQFYFSDHTFLYFCIHLSNLPFIWLSNPKPNPNPLVGLTGSRRNRRLDVWVVGLTYASPFATEYTLKEVLN